MDRIRKAAQVKGLTLDEGELALINQHTLRPLTHEEVFCYRIRVCDNEVDRDFERFPRASLDKLAGLLAGKTLLLDHIPRAQNQVSRIYGTQVLEDNGRATTAGEAYSWVEARCYMVRTDSNRDFIAEIEAGIKKEVSVGCSVSESRCSVCGAGRREGSCGHIPGRSYDGKTCYRDLEDPTDAYEVSFVAVPAQREAGVTKKKKPKEQPPKTNYERLKKLFGRMN